MESELLYLFSQPLFFSIQTWILSLSIILLLICSALISGSEIAFFSLNDNDKKKLEDEGSKVGQRILYLLSNPRQLLATIMIATLTKLLLINM
ncbi:MAG: DUF21 domain-containing protein, partial [Bacteroidota bacterium]